MSRGWIGFDLDGTLAVYDHWRGEDHIGEPVPEMVRLVQFFLAEGKYDVRIMTARASRANRDAAQRKANIKLIKAWCLTNIGQELEVTSEKDWAMADLYDDRCHRVEKNTGRVIGGVNE